MTRKIRRNFVRWFFRPFWKPKKKVAVDLPAPHVPRPVKTPFELEHFYLKANGEYLMPIMPDIGQYIKLFPAGGPDASHDLMAVMFGTTSQLLTHFYDFITFQCPDTNSTAVLLSGTSTQGDADGLAYRAREQAYWVRKSEPTAMGYRYIDNPR